MIDDIEWRVSTGLVDYAEALMWMETRAAAIAAGEANECVWLLEHPPLYTAGTSADPAELLDARFPVYVAGRGGRYTYHGPGQRIAYLMIDVGKRARDVRRFVHAVEGWAIATLARLGVSAYRVPGRIGIWTDDNGYEAKIGAIGIRVRKWVSLHGLAINLDPELSHYRGIVPCGIADFPVTSFAKLGLQSSHADFDMAFQAELPMFIDALTSLPKN